MPPRANTPNVKTLQQQNDRMREELGTLRNEFDRLQEALRSHEAAANEHGGHNQTDSETIKSLQYMSDEYDSLNSFRTSAKKDLTVLRNRLESLNDKVNEMAGVLDDMVQYSYNFNVKLLGIPEADPTSKEPALVTTRLCTQLFNAMGANVALSDIDIAHRVSSRNPSSNGPKPIICKFVRRIARNEVMSLRREISKVDPRAIGIAEDADLTKAIIMDHLTPKTQDLLFQAKKFKARFNYAYCWTKNQMVFLRLNEGSSAIKVMNMEALNQLTQKEMESET